MTRRALAFGEALIDCFPDRRVVAGAPLHVAVHLAALGWEVALVSRVGHDEDGRAIRSLLEERRVDASLLEVDPDLPTGTATVEMSDTEHRFTVHRPAAWDAIRGPASPPLHDILCYTGLSARAEGSRHALERLLSASNASLRVFDLTFRPPDVHLEAVRIGLARATVLKGNQAELSELAGMLGLGPEPTACFGAGPHLRWVCVTRGPEGASLYESSGESWWAPGKSAEVVDSVGAGDAFAAALVDGLARGVGEQRALERARDAGAATVARRGGLPQT